MRKLLTVLLVLALASFAWAGWNHSETIFQFASDDSVMVGGTGSISGTFYYMNSPHGIVVDADGKMWVTLHSGYGQDQSGSPEFVGYNHGNGDAADTCHFKPLYCFNADGTHASFSPITMFELPDGTMDTVYAESIDNGSGKGISLDADGNILWSSYSTVYRFDYSTGECIGKWTPSIMGSITEAVQDPENGLIYVGYVVPGGKPLYLLDEELELIGNAIDTTTQITRSLAVIPMDDGVHLYNGTTWSGHGTFHWFSADPEFEAFTMVDTLGNLAEFVSPDDDSTYYDVEMWSSSLDVTPDGNLLIGALRQGWAGPLGSRWWIMDALTGEYYEHFGTPVSDEYGDAPYGFYQAGGVNGPRGGFFTDENTLYTVDFYLWTVDKWEYTTDVVEEAPTARTFALQQNYPNPFNPNTTIPYMIDEAGNVQLSVYNVLGEKVASLVDEYQPAGAYNIDFNAGSMPTGMYIYKLQFNGQELTQKMLLVK